MKKKIICILVMTLLITTVTPAIGSANVEKNNMAKKSINQENPAQPCAIWTVQLSFDVSLASGGSGNAGAEYANNFFYSTRWASNLIHEYTSTGTLSKQFSIAGVTGLRDLAYCPLNGHFYGGAAAGVIYEMDFVSETLVSTITGGFQSRAIAYDDDLDAFYVSNWGDPVWVVDRVTGSILSSFNLGTTTSNYGFAYDNVCGGPYLWVFDQGGSGAMIYQWDLTSGVFTGISHDVFSDFPASTGIAGGLFFTDEFLSGYTTLGGLLQGSPDVMFCYEICEVTIPKICCDPVGLNFGDEIPVGTTVSGQIYVCNCGDPGSFLNWYVDTTNVPSWGTWTFTPDSGTGVPETGPCAIVNVTCVVTTAGTYTGDIYVYNADDPTDFCVCTTGGTWPRTTSMNHPLLQWLLQQFPLLRNLIGL